ncbi:two-component sensor histidine kinase [Amycolatopsis albispora]|uniref:histidine kinase n=2 Tax=Amycolatopsis albispora TaxID=1804986 RepID=A0A344LE59_9PSEU|nr:sensor histidine kinase [Amycolatopsis albispora]AXB46333.1 two-component sensor histidine kinase [Amycolatopsis albispora]
MVGDSCIALLLLLFDLLLFVVSATEETGLAVHPWYVTVPVDLLVVLPVVFRRKHPVWAAYAALLIGSVHGGLMLGVAGFFAGMIAVYTLVVYAGRRHGALYLLISLSASSIQLFVQTSDELTMNLILVVLAYALCWLLGEFVGARRAYHVEVEARLHLLETERDQATRIAVANERGRIARELHDVVAHAVSVIVVQADGASYAIRSNPDLAERAVQTISETGRGALAELRRLLDVLRNEDAESEPRVPQPNASSLTELAQRVGAAGLPVEVEVDENFDDLPAGVSLGVYRIVQESLTNTLKHGGPGAKAVVKVHREADGVRIEVADNGSGARPVPVPARGATAAPAPLPGGNGLIGMRERANVLGGKLEVGPRPGGGWRVHATLPVRLDP